MGGRGGACLFVFLKELSFSSADVRRAAKVVQERRGMHAAPQSAWESCCARPEAGATACPAPPRRR